MDREASAERSTSPRRSRLHVRPRGFVSVPGRPYDVHPDGLRVAGAAVQASEADAKRDHVVMIFNFFDELKRIAPPK